MRKYAIFSKGCNESNKIEKILRTKINLEYDEIKPEILFVIGGDGTILRAFHKYAEIVEDIIVFGIHTGHLGFLANYQVTDIGKILSILNSNLDCKIEEHTLLEFSIKSNEKETTGLALNEVSITAVPNMIELDVLVDKTLLETFRGGGLCISTPQGSTGYNKSLGGSVIDHNINCFQIAEIAGLNSNSYKTLMNPLVLAGNRKVELNNIGINKILFTYDNNSMWLDDFNSLCIKSSKYKIKFAYINDENFVKRVNKAFI